MSTGCGSGSRGCQGSDIVERVFESQAAEASGLRRPARQHRLPAARRRSHRLRPLRVIAEGLPQAREGLAGHRPSRAGPGVGHPDRAPLHQPSPRLPRTRPQHRRHPGHPRPGPDPDDEHPPSDQKRVAELIVLIVRRESSPQRPRFMLDDPLGGGGTASCDRPSMIQRPTSREVAISTSTGSWLTYGSVRTTGCTCL